MTTISPNGYLLHRWKNENIWLVKSKTINRKGEMGEVDVGRIYLPKEMCGKAIQIRVELTMVEKLKEASIPRYQCGECFKLYDKLMQADVCCSDGKI